MLSVCLPLVCGCQIVCTSYDAIRLSALVMLSDCMTFLRCCLIVCPSYDAVRLFALVNHPDTTFMVDWALKTNYLIYYTLVMLSACLPL